MAASSPVLDIASEVLKNPGLIKWNDKPQNVVVKKKTGEKIGLQYRVKQKVSHSRSADKVTKIVSWSCII